MTVLPNVSGCSYARGHQRVWQSPPTDINYISFLYFKHHQGTWKELLEHPEPRWPCSNGCQSSHPETKTRDCRIYIQLIWTDLGAHLLLSKLLDLLHSPGRLVLEPNPVQPLMHVDGVLTGNDLRWVIVRKFWILILNIYLAHGGPLLLLTTRWHLGKEIVWKFWFLTTHDLDEFEGVHVPVY